MKTMTIANMADTIATMNENMAMDTMENGVFDGETLVDAVVVDKPKTKKTTVKNTIKKPTIKKSDKKSDKPKFETVKIATSIIDGNGIHTTTYDQKLDKPNNDKKTKKPTVKKSDDQKMDKPKKPSIPEMKYNSLALGAKLGIDAKTARVYLRKLGIQKNELTHKYGWNDQTEFNDVVDKIQNEIKRNGGKK